ncbi:MAG: RibD family protein, partial [Gaiellaceae bacterium]
RGGDSKWISGEASRALVHEWRGASDAVAVGIGTALADDPLLTARVGGSGCSTLAPRQPRRVVFDSLAKLPLNSRLLDDAAAAPLTVVVSRAAPRGATDALATRGVDVICATGENEQARVRSALDQLGSAGVTSLMLEGGPKLAGVFLDAGEVDEVRLFIGPMLLGGRGARDPLESEGVETIAEAVRTLTLSCERVGDDLLLTGRIREW